MLGFFAFTRIAPNLRINLAHFKWANHTAFDHGHVSLFYRKRSFLTRLGRKANTGMLRKTSSLTLDVYRHCCYIESNDTGLPRQKD